MNYRGYSRQKELLHCRVCGMDAGVRKMTADGEKHAIVCEICGFKTHLHSTPGAATSEWNGTNKRGG